MERSHRPLLHCCLLYFFLLFSTASQAAPTLSSDLSISNEGYFVLSWDGEEADQDLVLQQATDIAFSSEIEEWVVTGASQFTQSGLVDGVYYFRLVDNTDSSNTISVEVAHHSLGRATFFFSLGAILFGVLVAILVIGRRQFPGDVGA